MTKLLDGKSISLAIQDEIAEEVRILRDKGHRAPCLVAVLVGEDPASETYVASKIKACERVGFTSRLQKLDPSISEEELLSEIEKLNNDKEVDGFIIQLPLPKHINETKVILAVDPAKDVDGFHPENVGRMALNLPCFLPATPYGIIQLLERYKVETAGKHCVVLGRSHIVGSPVSILLTRNSYPGNCTVTVCHSKTPDLSYFTKQADILVVAIGKPEFVTADMVKEGAVVVDVGIHRVEDASKKSGYRVTGDVRFDEVAAKSSFITPVPGGVGPMTIASLLKNTLQAVLS
jgi:methylenetetrahydrofolate dehydrogenase (NADP+) / methenyltetrahydrofolate cyclohydrolase